MRKLIKLTSALLVSTLSACALYQEPRGASSPHTTSEFAGRTAVPDVTTNTNAVWWQMFDDATLSDLIDQALLRNADIREALANVQAARAIQGLQRWEYLPVGGVTASHERTRVSLETNAGQVVQTATAAIGASWELDLFGRVRNGNRIAQANVFGSEAALDAARLLVVSETAATYFRLRATERKIEARVIALDQQQRLVELTRAMLDEARVSGDVLERALAELAGDEVALLREREQRRVLENRLAMLLGHQPGQWHLAEASDERKLQFRPAELGSVDTLLRRRPDIRMAAQAMIGRQAATGIERAGYFPSVSVSGMVGFMAGGFGDLGNSASETWTVLPTLHWNVLDFGRVTRRIQSAEAQADAAQARFDDTVLAAIEDTENALWRYGVAQQEMLLRDQARQHSTAAADAAQARYEEGIGTYLEALLARRDAISADINRTDSIADQRLATIGLFAALGLTP